MTSQQVVTQTQRLPSFSKAFAHHHIDHQHNLLPSNAPPKVSSKRATPALIPLSVFNLPKSNGKTILPPIIRLLSAKKSNAIAKTPDNSAESFKMGFEYFSKQNACNDQSKGEEIETIRAQHKSLWDAFSPDEKYEFAIAAKRKRKNDDNSTDLNVPSPAEPSKSPDKSSESPPMHQSTVSVAKNDFAPTLQEYPADYESILIDFE